MTKTCPFCFRKPIVYKSHPTKYTECLTTNCPAYGNLVRLKTWNFRGVDTNTLLQELLAHVHGDGGHHTTKVGLLQSVEDAKTRYDKLVSHKRMVLDIFDVPDKV